MTDHEFKAPERTAWAVSKDGCGYNLYEPDGSDYPCDRPAVGYRWYQDVGEHEDLLDVACEIHRNAGGDRMAELMAEVELLTGERDRAATDGPWLAVAGEGPSDWPIVIPDGSDLGTYLCASPDDGVRGGHSEADAKFIAAARADVPWLLSEVERLTAECDRARGLAARLEAQLAQVAEVVHGMETLRYVGMTTSADVSDVEAAARTQRAVRAHAADLWAALEGAPKDGDVEYQVDPVLEYQVDPVLEYLDRLKGMDPSPTLAGQIAELEAAHHAKNGGE